MILNIAKEKLRQEAINSLLVENMLAVLVQLHGEYMTLSRIKEIVKEEITTLKNITDNYHLANLQTTLSAVAATSDSGQVLAILLSCYKKAALNRPNPTIDHMESKPIAAMYKKILDRLLAENLVTDEERTQIQQELAAIQEKLNSQYCTYSFFNDSQQDFDLLSLIQRKNGI